MKGRLRALVCFHTSQIIFDPRFAPPRLSETSWGALSLRGTQRKTRGSQRHSGQSTSVSKRQQQSARVSERQRETRGAQHRSAQSLFSATLKTAALHRCDFWKVSHICNG